VEWACRRVCAAGLDVALDARLDSELDTAHDAILDTPCDAVRDTPFDAIRKSMQLTVAARRFAAHCAPGRRFGIELHQASAHGLS
jgi:hypothetical protein